MRNNNGDMPLYQSARATYRISYRGAPYLVYQCSTIGHGLTEITVPVMVGDWGVDAVALMREACGDPVASARLHIDSHDAYMVFRVASTEVEQGWSQGGNEAGSPVRVARYYDFHCELGATRAYVTSLTMQIPICSVKPSTELRQVLADISLLSMWGPLDIRGCLMVATGELPKLGRVELPWQLYNVGECPPIPLLPRGLTLMGRVEKDKEMLTYTKCIVNAKLI